MTSNFFATTRRGFLHGAAGFAAASYLLPSTGRAAEGFKFITPFGYSLSFSAVLYGKTGGYYAKEGLDVEVIGGKGAAMAAQMTIGGQADTGRTGGANFIVSKVKNGAPITSIATIAQVSPFYILSPKARGIVKVGDFKGKTFGMASLGGSMENTLNFMLRQGDVDPKTVNKVKVADTPAAFGLIEAGRIDGFMGNVSTAVKLTSTNPAISAIKVNDGIPGQVYVARDSDIGGNADRYVRFLRATIASATAILKTDDLTPILESIGGTFKIRTLSDMENARQDLKANAELWSANGMENLLRNVPAEWAGGVKLMGEAGMIPEGTDATKLYTNAIWDKARA